MSVVMKNIKASLLLIFILPCFSGCAVFQGLFDFSSSKEPPTSTQTGTKVNRPVPNQKQGTHIFSQIYKTPESYEQAYTYRTDVPESKIRMLLRDTQIDALRVSNPKGYVLKIIEEINKIAKNDFEKIKMIHDVVALLVLYDAKSYWQGTAPRQDWQTVLAAKVAVCEGYSNLFKYMCDVASVPCEKVSGYARGVGSNIEDEELPNNSNHAWNIVKINNAWYMIDCTWDAGYMEGRIAKQKYTTDYLFLKPEHMIYTHFPSDSRKQLLLKTISAHHFYNLPEVKPKFFDACKMQELPSKKMFVKNSLHLPYSLNGGFELSFRLTNSASKAVQKNCIFVQNDGDSSHCIFSFPQKGIYLVDVFWSKTNARDGSGCMQFIVEAEEASAVKYPQVYSVTAKNVKLISPIEMPLKAGEPIVFSVYVENRKFVAVIYGRNFIPLQSQGDGFFTGEITIPTGVKQVSLSFSQSERGSYQTFAQFSVE